MLLRHVGAIPCMLHYIYVVIFTCTYMFVVALRVCYVYKHIVEILFMLRVY